MCEMTSVWVELARDSPLISSISSATSRSALSAGDPATRVLRNPLGGAWRPSYTSEHMLMWLAEDSYNVNIIYGREGKVLYFTPNDHDEADANICTSRSLHLSMMSSAVHDGPS